MLVRDDLLSIPSSLHFEVVGPVTGVHQLDLSSFSAYSNIWTGRHL